jgi:hypothetical protein
MGYNPRKTPFQHATLTDMLRLFRRFYRLHIYFNYPWKNYVLNEHTRVIIEMTPNPLMFGRSLFRSTQAFADPEEIEDVVWTEYWVAKMKISTQTIDILMHSPPDKYEDIKTLYKQHNGTASWCN